MSKTFGSFRDELVSSGVLLQHLGMKQSLQRLAEKSDALVTLSRADSSGKSPDVEADADADVDVDVDAEGVDSASTSSVPDAATILPTVIGDSPEYNALYASTNAPFASPLPYQPAAASMEMISSSSLPSLPSLYPHNQQPSLPAQLPLPTSYSFHESSFVRRLRRHCMEYGYRLLSDTRTDPREVSRMFRFSLGFRNCETMLARFCAALSRSNIDDRYTQTSGDNSIAHVSIPPYYHVGNAGTHFPPSNPSSSSSPMNSSSSTETYPVSKFIGPWSFHFADLPHNKTSIEELLVSKGMGGEWFDANDVDGYLKAMGISIDAHSAYVTVPGPSIEDAAESSGSSSGNSPTSFPSSQSQSQSQPQSSIGMPIDPFLDSSTSASSTNGNTALQFSLFDIDMNINIDDLLAPLPESEKPFQPEYPLNMQSFDPFTPNNTTNNTKQNTPRILDVERFLDRKSPPLSNIYIYKHANSCRPHEQSRLSRREIRLSQRGC
jgi:hypothetical protein